MSERPSRRLNSTIPNVVDRLAVGVVLPPGERYKCPRCCRTLTTKHCLACQATDAVEFKLAEKRRAIAVEKILANLPETACRVEGCDGKPNRRGLCSRCYANAAANVGRGKTSWEELERLQIIRPKQPPRADSPFSKMLVKMREAAN